MTKYIVTYTTDDGQWDFSGDDFHTLEEARAHVAEQVEREPLQDYNDSAFHDYHIYELMPAESVHVSVEVSRTKTVTKL